MLDAEALPVALLALRVAVVVLLYLFLATAFRTLRAELRAAATPERPRPSVPTPAYVDVPPARTTVLEPPVRAWEDDWEDDWEDEELLPAPVRDAPVLERNRVRLRVWLPVAAVLLVAGFGGTAWLLAGEGPGAPPASSGVEATPVSPLEPPTVAPRPGRVTVGLATLEDAQLRVTVDGTVEFDGTLRRGERQAWEAGERIQVWTDNGRNVQLAVNGVDLGAYSPAMGHPDWNRIDFGFWPGWAQ